MSKFGDRFQSSFARLLDETGDAVCYKPHPNDVHSTHVYVEFAIVGDLERVAKENRDGHEYWALQRSLTISTDRDNANFSGIENVKTNAKVEINGEDYSIESISEESMEGVAELRLEKLRVARIQRRDDT